MIFHTLGRVVNPALSATARGSWWLTRKTVLPVARLAGQALWASTKSVAKSAPDPLWQVTKDVGAIAMHAPGMLYRAGRALTHADPQGRSFHNLFTGRALRPAAVLGAEVAAIGYTVSQGPQLSLQRAAQPAVMPQLTISGNPLAVEAAQGGSLFYDKLLGARGGLAFALHRLRHG